MVGVPLAVHESKRHHLVCPVTHERLTEDGDALVSPRGNRYRILPSGQVDFGGQAQASASTDWLASVKSRVKYRLGPAYTWLVYGLGPVMPRIHWPSRQLWWQYRTRQLSQGKELVIEIGGGTYRTAPEVVNFDIFPYPEVDVVADCTRLPLADASVDGVISLAVMEHVADPDACLREARRVLKPGGFILTGVPFLQGFHASPNDYYRWTPNGLQALHDRHGFQMVSVEPFEGPTSSLVWILQEWLAIALSFGLDPLYYFWFMIFSLLLLPLKLLDLVLIHYPQSYRINCFNFYHGVVPHESSS